MTIFRKRGVDRERKVHWCVCGGGGVRVSSKDLSASFHSWTIHTGSMLDWIGPNNSSATPHQHCWWRPRTLQQLKIPSPTWKNPAAKWREPRRCWRLRHPRRLAAKRLCAALGFLVKFSSRSQCRCFTHLIGDLLFGTATASAVSVAVCHCF